METAKHSSYPRIEMHLSPPLSAGFDLDLTVPKVMTSSDKVNVLKGV